MTIKAIETSYKGYRFRSRLEARWAVFFDSLGIAWEYEKEGFVSNGKPYLPDFWLLDYKAHLEIKPGNWSLWDAVRGKEWAFAEGNEEGDNLFLVLAGNPWPWEYYFFSEFQGTLLPFPTAQFAICSECGSVRVVVSSVDAERDLWPLAFASSESKCGHVFCWCRPNYPVETHHLGRAYVAARSARFEHGEAG